MTHDVGVLLIHGIGQQRRGQTLADFGEPMVEWIQRWMDGLSLASGITQSELNSWLRSLEGTDRPLCRDAALDDPELEVLNQLWHATSVETLRRRRILDRLVGAWSSSRSSGLVSEGRDLKESALSYVGGLATIDRRFRKDCPPNFSLDIQMAGVKGDIATSSWLFAESHWAESFPAPESAKVTAWSILVAPWLIANIFASRISRAFYRFSRTNEETSRWRRLLAFVRWLVLMPLSLLGIPLVLSVQLTLAILLLPGLIPLAAFRRYADRIRRKFAAVVGDCYAFSSSPLRTALIVDRVQADMEWLAGRCKNLVIVAHSQGAAVSQITLKRRRPSNLRLLVTLGSALRKLTITHEIQKPGLRAVKVAVGLGIATSAILAYVAWRYWVPIPWMFAGGLGKLATWEVNAFVLAVLYLTVMWLGTGVDEGDMDFWPWAQSLGIRGIRWLDCYASADPVPDGATFDPNGKRGPRFNPPEGWKKLEVYNTGSAFYDHTRYMTNRDDCLAQVVCEISLRAESGVPLQSLTSVDEDVVKSGSQRRGLRVGQLRLLRLVSIVSAIVLAWAHWSQLSQMGARLDERLRVSSVIPGWLWQNVEDPQRVLGLIGIAAITGLLSLVPFLAWKVWNRYESWLFFRRMPPTWELSGWRIQSYLSFYLLNFGTLIFLAAFSWFLITIGYLAFLWPTRVSTFVLVISIGVVGALLWTAMNQSPSSR